MLPRILKKNIETFLSLLPPSALLPTVVLCMACINPVILFPARHPTGLFHGSEGAGRGEGEPLRAAAVREQHLQPTEGRTEDSAPARDS